jgi:antitoxin (DNA-binding transcriptional repressor) of toxin-antitoxin stability system
MRAVGIKQLKNKLSTYVHLAAGGETILVTDRDRVVAELVPPRAGRSEIPSDAIVAEVVRRGWMTPAAIRDGVPLRRPLAPAAVILAELSEDRRDR